MFNTATFLPDWRWNCCRSTGTENAQCGDQARIDSLVILQMKFTRKASVSAAGRVADSQSPL